MKMLQDFLLVSVLATLPVPAHGVDFVALADATPGRTGVCITEMDGGERVEIPLTVLGTVGSGAPRSEIVLVRLDDPRLAETGIIAGMSGSPVYLDGRLLGALAYGWPFSTEPIGGVTPFERMVEIGPTSDRLAVVGGRPEMSQLLASAADGSLGAMLLDWLLPSGADQLQPLPLAVNAGGLALPADGSWLAESWRRMGWSATPGGSATGEETGAELAPGAMVASVLVDGDATLAAGGTVTEIRGDRLWAFGHPFLGAGAMRMPLARANVVAVLPSLMSSFKFFTVGPSVGAVVADRKDGIVGRLGEEAPMVPVRVTVGEESYTFRAVGNPVLLPLLSAYLSQSCQAVDGRTFGDQTVRGRVVIRYPEFEPVVVQLNFSGVQAAAEASGFVAAVVAYLENTPFAGPEIESIDVSIERVEEIQAAVILEVVPDRRVVSPGDELDVRFRIRPYRGPEAVYTLKVAIPEGISPGRLDLVGADGAAWTAYDLQMRPFHPASFGDEVRLVNSLQPSTTLVVALEREDLGISVGGGSLSAPPSIVLQLRSALGPNLETVSYAVFAKTSLEVPMAVAGAQRIQLTVREERQ
jgi:hypothetical protein